MKVTLIDKNTNGINTVIQALSLCRDKQCTESTVDHCLTAKPVPHLSALEFTWFCFLVEGVSIKTRLQQARHRHFSSMERSTRSINMDSAEVILPTTTKHKEHFAECYDISCLGFNRANICETNEDAAYLLPLGTETKFVLAGNGRVWFEYLRQRLCKKHVQAEHYELAKELSRQLIKEVSQFEYAHPCNTCGACKTKAQREGNCLGKTKNNSKSSMGNVRRPAKH